MLRQTVRAAVLAALTCSIIPACNQRDSSTIVLSGTIEADSARAGSRTGGRVIEVMVDEGSVVNEGDVLLTLDTSVLEAERARAEALVGEAEAAYAVVAAGARSDDIERARHEAEALRQGWLLAQAGPLPEEIAALEEQAGSFEAVYRNARDAADRMQRLYDEGAVSERERVAAQDASDAAYSQWQAALQQLEALKSRPRDEEVQAAHARYLAALNAAESLAAGPTSEQLDSALARITTAQRAIDRVDADIAEATVVAPISGIVSRFSLMPGDFVTPGQASCEIVQMQQLKLIVYLPENRLGFVGEGDQLPVRVDSFPDETFTGTVMRISAEAEFTPRNVQVVEERVTQVFAVEISLANPDGRLRPGMAADVTIDQTGRTSD